jgi:ATP-dependent Lon protease
MVIGIRPIHTEEKPNNNTLTLSGIINHKILNQILSTIKKQKIVHLVINDDVDMESDDLESFLMELKKMKMQIKKTITIDISRLKVENFTTIIEVVINFLDLFQDVAFGLLNNELKKILDQKIDQLECIVESQPSQNKKANIEIKKLKLTNAQKNIQIILTYKEKIMIKKNTKVFVNGQEINVDDAEDFMPFGFGGPMMAMGGNTNKGKKDNTPGLERMNTLLESKEIDEDVKSAIRNLLDKINQRGSNPNNDSERVKYLDIINVISKIFLLKKEDEAKIKNTPLGKLIRLSKANEMKEYLKYKEEMVENLFKILIPSKSAKKIVDVLMKAVDNIIQIKINNKVIKRSAILLHGEPGLGKTTVPKEFAKVNNIPYVILNAGDEKKFFIGGLMIYSGSSWGKIAQIMADKNAKTIVIILDEVDKYSKETQESLLPLLDVNQKFMDQHLELPLPIDQCIFVLTANNLSNMSDPLKDRCEIINVDHFSFVDKKELAKRTLHQGLSLKFPDKTFEISSGALDLIVRKSQGSGGRQVQNNTQTVISYVTNMTINSNSKVIKVNEQNIHLALDTIEFNTSPIIAEESKVGYINGIVVKTFRENYKENKVHGVTNISCVAGSDFNNQHIITPVDQNLNSLVQSISRSSGLLLSQMALSNKNLNISIKEPDVSFYESRSLAALLAVAIISAIANKAVKSSSTIIAELLPNNDLEFDPKTAEKIQLGFNYGLRRFVIGNLKPSSSDDDNGSPYSYYINNLIRKFNLKLKKQEGNKLIFYHDAQSSKEDNVYGDLEICVVTNLKEALEYLLVK